MQVILNHNDILALLNSMAEKLKDHLVRNKREQAVMIGIHTGGVWIAEHLHRMLNLTDDLGKLNIAFYRDDFSQIGLHPQVTPTNLPFSIDNKHIILVDDILYTGRTIRAAHNIIFDYGRPASVSLVVLGERAGRELPIQADIVGKHLASQKVKLIGAEPLNLVINDDE
jgi:pyrimidine operon attenuation protein/uracil phosphoribosyltransferase